MLKSTRSQPFRLTATRVMCCAKKTFHPVSVNQFRTFAKDLTLQQDHFHHHYHQSFSSPSFEPSQAPKQKQKRSIFYWLSKIIILLVSWAVRYAIVAFLFRTFHTTIDNPDSSWYNEIWANRLRGFVAFSDKWLRYIYSMAIIALIGANYSVFNMVDRCKQLLTQFGLFSEKEQRRQDVVNITGAKLAKLLLVEQRGVYMILSDLLVAFESHLPEAYAKAFKELNNMAPVIGEREVRAVIKKELGKPIEDLFKEFNFEPIHADHICQTHKATTKDGRVVSIRVKYPLLKLHSQSDVECIQSLAKFLTKYASNPELIHVLSQVNKLKVRVGLSRMEFRPDLRRRIYRDLSTDNILTGSFDSYDQQKFIPMEEQSGFWVFKDGFETKVKIPRL